MSITLIVEDGPKPITVPWSAGMNAQAAVEVAHQQKPHEFSYALQYYGVNLGYLVSMINETYDSYMAKAAPYFYWEFLVNNKPSSTGIDSTVLHDSDVMTFRFVVYNAKSHASTPLAAKHKLRTGQSDS